jgi:flagellin
LNTLATQAANGTLQDEDRDQIQLEVDQLVQELSNITGKTKFNGITLLNGTTSSVTFQVGWENGTTITADLGSGLTNANLGITNLDISSQSAAQAALTKIQSAITKVSNQRATLGAVQNRLEHTINNVGVNAENLSASESRIRDADIAQEMTEFTKNQILVQAGTAMLAQANAIPQNVLRLLG